MKKIISLFICILIATPAYAVKEYAKRFPNDSAMEVYTPNNPPPASAEVDGVIGNEVTNVTNATLTRSGSGTSGSPYTLGLNLSNANTWAAQQTFSPSIVTPLVIGGTATTADLNLQTTSGIGTTGADMHFLVGNNGATEAMTILNSGFVGIGTTSPSQMLTVGNNNQFTVSSAGQVTVPAISGFSVTTPQILFPNAGGTLGIYSDASNALRFTVAGVRVGGWNASGLSVEGGIGSASVLNIAMTGAGDTGFFTPANDTLGFATNGTEAMRITSTGNVGIGTVAPTAKLEVVGSATEGIRVIGDASDTSDNIGKIYYNRGGATTFSIVNSNSTNALLSLGTGSNLQTLNLYNGNVGVGISVPLAILHVNGADQTGIRIASTVNSPILDFYQTGLNSANARNWRIETNGDNYGDIGFFVSSANNTAPPATGAKMVIDKSGNVGIGETSPQKRLHVYDSTVGVSIAQMILQGADAGYGAGVSFQSVLTGGAITEMARITADGEDAWNTTAATQDAGLRFFTTLNGTAAEKMRINASGNVGIGNTDPSAARLVVKGTGATSATTALIIEDSNLTDYFTVKNDGTLAIGKAITLTDNSTYSLVGMTGGDVTVTNNTGGNRSGTTAGMLFSMTLTNSGVSDSFTNGVGGYFNIDSRNSVSGNILTGVLGSARLGNASGRAERLTGASLSANSNDATGGTIDILSGIIGSATNNNAGVTSTNLQALKLTTTNVGITTTAYGINLASITNSGTITDTYGLYIGDVTSGTQTNQAYGLYQSDASARNYFAGNVGIGTTTPGYALTVSGGAATTAQFNATAGDMRVHFARAGANQMILNHDGTLGQFGTVSGGGNLALQANGSIYQTITTAGNVGIGTTAPDKALEINHATGANLRLTYNDSTGSAANYADFSTSSSGDLTIAPSGGDTVITGTLNVSTTLTQNSVAVPTISSTSTLTNKRITHRAITAASDTTAVIDVDVTDDYYLTAMAGATEISTTGTPTSGQTIFIGLKDDGTGRALTWTGITALGVTLPTTTVANKQHIVSIKYIASAWRAIAVSVEA